MKLRPWFLIVVALAALGLLAAPQLILSAPREATMGFVQKIFYYHVPSAWVCFFTQPVGVGASAAVVYSFVTRFSCVP